MKKITICIPTHCIKTETRGPWNGVQNLVPSAPSAKMIDTILNSLFTNIDITPDECHIHIGFDKRKNREIDNQYEQNLLLLLQNFPNTKLIVNETDSHDPIVTAPQNFMNLIDSVETDYYLFWEHDWLFNAKISLRKIIEEMDINNKINWIKFNQFKNNNDVHQHIQMDMINDNFSDNIPLLATFSWSNNPYICRTKIFRNWWKTFIYPTGEQGGFVEGPLNVFYQFYASKIGWTEAIKLFGCFVYGRFNDEPTVRHLNGNAWQNF